MLCIVDCPSAHLMDSMGRRAHLTLLPVFVCLVRLIIFDLALISLFLLSLSHLPRFLPTSQCSFGTINSSELPL